MSIDPNHSDKCSSIKHTINLYDAETETKKFSIKAKSDGVSFESDVKLIVVPVLHLQHSTGDIIDVASFLNGLKESTDTDKYQILQFIQSLQEELQTTSLTLSDKVTNLTKSLITEVSTRSTRDTELQKEIDNLGGGGDGNNQCPRTNDVDLLREEFDCLKAEWQSFTCDE